MPAYTINTDNLAAKPDSAINNLQDVVEQIIVRVGASYAQTFGSTDLDDALGDYLASVQEGRTIGMVKQIRQHAAGLLAAGVAAPGGKLVACTQAHVDNLTAFTGVANAALANITTPAVDGTRWPVNTQARANTLLNAMTARIAAVNGARDAAIARFQALTPQQKRDFQFSSIVWP